VAEMAQVDAMDEWAVDEHVDAVAASAGGIDVSFNLISYRDVQGTPLAEMPLEDFERPVMSAVRTQFLTSRAARHMISQGSGVILFFGGYGDPVPDYYLGGFQVALNAIESLRRQLASELGGHGIRAVTLQTGGVPETVPESFDAYNAERLRAADTLLLGRVSYQGFKGFWPSVADDPDATPIQRDISHLNNAIDKVVISDSLTPEEAAPWHNTRII